MVNLAIKGHKTRGKEVIQILQMLGGCKSGYEGYDNNFYYYINQYGNIEGSTKPYEFEKYIVFTLEEFLKKFPYKVGDQVIDYEGDAGKIVNMSWDEDVDELYYSIQYHNGTILKYPVGLLQPYKEETMEEKTDKALAPDLIGEDYSGKRFGYKIPNGYELDCIRNNKIILKPKQPQYPKTYDECCKVLGLSDDEIKIKVLIHNIEHGEAELYRKFIGLKRCRDAYWKIAGEEMGLGKPWEPDWNNVCDKYTIYTVYGNEIWRDTGQTINTILAFPTTEMRDAFYENFKDLIEACKELL